MCWDHMEWECTEQTLMFPERPHPAEGVLERVHPLQNMIHCVRVDTVEACKHTSLELFIHTLTPKKYIKHGAPSSCYRLFKAGKKKTKKASSLPWLLYESHACPQVHRLSQRNPVDASYLCETEVSKCVWQQEWRNPVYVRRTEGSLFQNLWVPHPTWRISENQKRTICVPVKILHSGQ